MRILLVLVVLALLATPAFAGSTLLLDGSASAQHFPGENVSVLVIGQPSRPAWLLLDISPGPTQAFGQTLPLGFSPFMHVFALGPLPPSGALNLVPKVPTLSATLDWNFYLLAAVSVPGGLEFSGGASLTIFATPSAGPPQGTLVGRQVTLDGRSIAAPDASCKPNVSVQWILSAKPAGSAAQLAGANQPFPTLTPDVPGDYQVQGFVNAHGKSFQPTTVVHAWKLDLTPKAGSVVADASSAHGVLTGPTLTGTSINGQPAMGPSPNDFHFDPDIHFAAFDPAPKAYELRAVHADGSVLTTRFGYHAGPDSDLSSPDSSLSLELKAPALQKLEDLAELALEGGNLPAQYAAIPPQTIVNGAPVFSAFFDPTTMTLNPNYTLTWVPTDNGLDTTVTLTNVSCKATVSGEIVFVDYSLTGTFTASSIVFHANTVVAAPPLGGPATVTLTSAQVTLNGAGFTLPGFLGSVSQLTSIQTSIANFVINLVKSNFVTMLDSSLTNSLLALAFDASPAGADVEVSAVCGAADHHVGGLTVWLVTDADVGSVVPGSPQLDSFMNTVDSPDFGPQSPGGLAYDAATAVGKGYMNKVLAACTESGLLEGPIETAPSVPLTLTAGELAQLLPGAGFGHLAPATPVHVRSHATVAPALWESKTAPVTELSLPNLELLFTVETSYGPLPWLRVALDGMAEGSRAISVTSGLDVDFPQPMSAAVRVVQALPGLDVAALSAQAAGLASLADLMRPRIVQALDGLPLASLHALGFDLSILETVEIGFHADLLARYGLLVPAL